MTLKTLVSEYTTVARELEQLEKKSGVQTLREKLDETKNKIKDLARSMQDSEIEKARTDIHFIRVDRPYKRYYDLTLIRKHANSDELVIIEKEALKVDVDTLKFESLVKGGLVDRKVQQKCFKEEAQTPRVSIQVIKE